jgi:hypothetical protein
VERAARRAPLRLGGGRILPPHVERSTTKMAIFKSVVERIFVNDRRAGDVD